MTQSKLLVSMRQDKRDSEEDSRDLIVISSLLTNYYQTWYRILTRSRSLIVRCTYASCLPHCDEGVKLWLVRGARSLHLRYSTLAIQVLNFSLSLSHAIADHFGDEGSDELYDSSFSSSPRSLKRIAKELTPIRNHGSSSQYPSGC